MHNFVKITAMILCGLVAGTVGAVYGPTLVSHAGIRAVTTSVATQAGPSQAAATPLVTAYWGSPIQPESTQARDAVSANSANDPRANSAPSDHELTAAVERDTAFLGELTQEHEREDVDPSWGPSATAALNRDLYRAAEGQFRVVKVDCRTTLCLSTLEWRSYEEAKEKALQLASRELELNCARELLLIPPRDPSAVYRGTFILNCLEQR